MTEKANSRILVADDHPIVRQGMVKLVTEANDLECIAEVDGVEEAVDTWSKEMPDLGIFDLRMADGDAVGAITRIKSFDPTARILVVSTFDGEEEVFRVMKAGAMGYMLKSSQPREILDAVKTVLDGRRYLPGQLAVKLADRVSSDNLSQRETEILTLVANGQSNAALAKSLGIATSTVKFHLNNIYYKLGVSSRTGAIAVAAKRGIIAIE